MSDRIILGPDGRKYITNEPLLHEDKQAAELRRLHALNAELVEAMQAVVEVWFRPNGINYVDFKPYMEAARAALAKTQGEMK